MGSTCMEYIHTNSRNVHETGIFAKIKALDLFAVNTKMQEVMDQVVYWGLRHPDRLYLGLLLDRQ